MSDVLAVFGTVFVLAVTFPALLLVLWLFFPTKVARARRRVDGTPGRCLALGVLSALVLAVPVGVLLAVPAGPVRLAGFVSMVAILVVSFIGQAGIAAALGGRMLGRTERRVSPIVAFLSGALTLELASGLPVVGWFFVAPIVALTGLGAAVFALLGREAKPQPEPVRSPNATISPAGARAPSAP